MRLRLALILPLAATALTGTAAEADAACAGAGVAPTANDLGRARAATLCLLNQQRTGRGLAPLRQDSRLLRAARAYARAMARDDFFQHVSAVNGSTLTDRIRAVGYRGGQVGENIAWGTGRLAAPARIVATWMRSPGHRRNILTPSYRTIGIGIVNGAPRPGGRTAQGATYTTDFGTRG